MIYGRSSRPNVWFAPGLLVFLAILIAPVQAQVSNVSATLEGTITDNTGAVIQGAEVRLRNNATNQIRTIRTDEQGLYRASELPVGTYEVQLHHPGFVTYMHAGVILSVGQTLRLNIALIPAGAGEAVTITDQPATIDASQTGLTSTIDTERIEELPVLSRNYLNFVLLAPGVAGSNQQGTNTPAQVADSGFTFGGLRARSNNLSIDGLDNNDEYTGASRTELSLETIREFQVVNNGLSAEFGGASGGSINVVTRTGTNQLHGDAFLFVQDGPLNAREPLTSESKKGDLNRYRVGLALGGPLVRDRTFYYAAFEQEHNRAQASTDIDPEVASAVNRVLRGGAFPRLGTRSVAPGLFPTARAETEASAKINHQLSSQLSLMIRYALTNNREAGDAFNTGGLTDASGRGSAFTQDHALVGSLVSLFGTKAVGDFRFQVATRRVTLRTNDQAGPEVDINGLINFGRPYDGNDRRRENHYEAGYTLTLSRSAHLIKTGVTTNRVRLDSVAPDGFGGVYVFRGLSDFVAGRADSFRQAFGDAGTNFAVTSYGGFAQDRWSAGKRLTIDIGLRYDFGHLPAGLNQDTNNVSPRVGMAYSPSDRWVLRAGYGVFHDRYVLAFLNRAVEKNGVSAFEQVAEGPSAAAVFQAVSGGSLVRPLAALAPSVFRPDPRLATPYSQQANFGIQRLVINDWMASASYLFVRGVKLGRTRNVNLMPAESPTGRSPSIVESFAGDGRDGGRAVFGPARLDPRFNGIYLLEDSASSTYHGLSLALNRRMANEFEFSTSYTFSKTIDDASDFDEQPENPLDLRAERALSRNHQGHRLVTSMLFELPFGDEDEGKSRSPKPRTRGFNLLAGLLEHIEVAPIVTVGSGRPVDPLTGVDSNLSGAFPISSRPPGFGRNTLRTPWFASVDLRVLKYLRIGDHGKLDFVAEAFNLVNRTNVSQINPFFGPGIVPMPGFGLPIEASGARHLQFSIDFEF